MKLKPGDIVYNPEKGTLYPNLLQITKITPDGYYEHTYLTRPSKLGLAHGYFRFLSDIHADAVKIGEGNKHLVVKTMFEEWPE